MQYMLYYFIAVSVSARLSVFTISSPRLAAGGVLPERTLLFLGADWRRAGRVRHHAHHRHKTTTHIFVLGIPAIMVLREQLLLVL